MRLLSWLKAIVCMGLLALPARAQVPEGTPNPCFEFYCYESSDFGAGTLAGLGAMYRGLYVFTTDAAGEPTFQALLLNPSPRPATDPSTPDPHVRDYGFGRKFVVHGDQLLTTAELYDAATDTSEERLLLFQRRGTTWSLRQSIAPRGAVMALALDRGTLLVSSSEGVEVSRRSQ
jgi:hypothetical protein